MMRMGAYRGIDVAADLLKHAIEGQHGGIADLASIEEVMECFEGREMWRAEVHVFDLEGHPRATRAYAWASPIEGTARHRVYTRLHSVSVRSPLHAVKEAILQDGHPAIGKASAGSAPEEQERV